MEDMLLSPPELRESLRDRAQARLRGDEVPGHYLTPMLTRSGETRWIEAATSRVKIGGEPLILITGVDITERKQAEQKLLESETKFRAVADSSHATITLSNEQRFVYVNPRAEEVTGYTQTELLKMKFTELLPPDMQQVVDLRAQARLRGEDAPNHYEVPFLKKDGEPRWLGLTVTVVELGGEALSLATVVELGGIDITARKHQEQALRAAEAELHAQKLNIVGRLAGTVAHDFNNLLTLVVGHSDLLLRSMPEDDPHRASVTAIAQAADSATALTQRLLGLSRRDLIHPRVLHPNETVTKTQHLLPGLIGEHIQVVVDLDPDVANIRVDPNQLEQVLINLAANGRDAMPEGGVLRIATMNTACDAAFVRAHRGAEPGAYVAMSVSDTGHGMDEATAAQVFEPFYTTKAGHEGTGLGLATVHDIVTRGGGFITLETAPERGSTFTAYFPKVDGGEDPIVVAPSSEEPVGGTETILLVEDDGPLRSLLGSRLQDLGYTVLSACDGPEALELCGEDVPIDLLFTDVVMPGMNGRELMEHLTARAPRLRTLFMSGYTDAILGPRNTLDVEVPLLRKPFTPDEAARQIRQVLGAG